MRLPPGGHLHQPVNSRVCGPTCVAMVAKCSIKAACIACANEPEKHGTHGTHLIRALTILRIRCSPKSLIHKGSNLLPCDFGILRLRMKGNKLPDGRWWGGHWILVWNGIIFDPSPGSQSGKIGVGMLPGMHITSYVKIYP